MATKRLTQWDRSAITNPIFDLTQRLQYTEQPPIKTDAEIERLLQLCAGEEVWETWHKLQRLAPSAVMVTRYFKFAFVREYNADTSARAGTRSASLYASKKLPETGHYTIPSASEEYWQWNDYADKMHEVVEKQQRAIRVIRLIVDTSTSAGQINTVLPFLASYMPPKVQESLTQAVRKSRWPAALGSELTAFVRKYRAEAHDQLAIASLLPEDIRERDTLRISLGSS